MNNQEYLAYFQPTAHAPDGPDPTYKRIDSRPKTTQYQRTQHMKLLPHVTEEYQFRITNQLLDQKIKHPKRDKIIVQSLTQSELRKDNSASKTTKNSQHRSKPRDKQNNCGKSQESLKKGESEKSGERIHSNTRIMYPKKRKQIERAYKTFDDINSPCHNYMNQYLIALENNRMGKRLINTRSVVQDILTKTYYTYQLYNGKILNRDKFVKIKRDSVHFRSCNKNFGKINNGIKSFFHKVIQPTDPNLCAHVGSGTVSESLSQDDITRTMIREDKHLKLSQARQNTHHGFQTNNPHILETFGQGIFTLVIQRIIIHSNPPIKPQTILLVQLVEKYHKLTEILNRSYAQKNNFFKYHCKTQSGHDRDNSTSASFPYEYISSQAHQNFGLRFKVHKKEEVYLRILRNQGIQQRELGVVKIDLQDLARPQQSEFPVNVVRQLREIDGVMHQRRIYESQFSGKLLKLKKGVTPTQVQIEYSFYSRRFKKVTESPATNSTTFAQQQP